MTFQLGTPQMDRGGCVCSLVHPPLRHHSLLLPGDTSITLDIIDINATQSVKGPVEALDLVRLLALILTISTSIVIADKPEADFAAADAFATVCVCFAGLSTLQFVQVVLECVVHLIYTEPLDPAGVMRYLIANNGAIGGPAFSTVLASFHFCLAMLVWIALNYGLPALVFLGIIFAVMIVITVDTVRKP